MHAEFQEGKFQMRTKEHFQRLGTMSACLQRLLDAALKFETQEPTEEK